MKSLRVFVGALALAGLAPAILPSLAAAEPNAVLYEVTENLRLRQLMHNQRVATAVLSGTVAAGTAVCPAEIALAYQVPYCVLTATATDRIDIATGKGPVSGTYRVHVQGDNPVDGAELVVLEGTWRGEINLAMALLGQDGIPNTGDELPLGTLENGRWDARGVRGGPLQALRAAGKLDGRFRLPFVMGYPLGCEVVGGPSACYGFSSPLYLGEAGPVEVAPNEYSIGVPTVKLEITFVEVPAGDAARE